MKADLAVTDLYPDNWPQGEIFVRVTDNGPGSPSNVSINMACTIQKHPYDGSPPSASGANGFLTISLVPGETGVYDTGIYLDGTTSWFTVTCSVEPPFDDTNPSNNSYSETFPPPP